MFLLTTAVLAFSACTDSVPVAPQPIGRVDSAATGVLRASAARLQAAKTIRVSARHQLDPALGLGTALDEGPLEISVQRPNRFHVIQPAGRETREIAYNGRELCVMHPELNHHALEPLRASNIEQFAHTMDERFGFRPPVAELLSEDMVDELMHEVSSAQITGTERVGGITCDRVHLWQNGMTTDLWIGREDKLPQRMFLTFTDLPGSPTWDIRFTHWELDAPVDSSLFSKRPAAGSFKVQMVRSR